MITVVCTSNKFFADYFLSIFFGKNWRSNVHRRTKPLGNDGGEQMVRQSNGQKWPRRTNVRRTNGRRTNGRRTNVLVPCISLYMFLVCYKFRGNPKNVYNWALVIISLQEWTIRKYIFLKIQTLKPSIKNLSETHKIRFCCANHFFCVWNGSEIRQINYFWIKINFKVSPVVWNML